MRNCISFPKFIEGSRACWVCVCVCVWVCGGGGGGYLPLLPPPPTFFKFVVILTKCIGKISRPDVVGKFGVFYHKKTKCRILSKSSPAEIKLLPAMTAFKEVLICTDDYNNEYLAVKYIRFFTNDMICL